MAVLRSTETDGFALDWQYEESQKYLNNNPDW
jgi:hypothetical protein